MNDKKKDFLVFCFFWVFMALGLFLFFICFLWPKPFSFFLVFMYIKTVND